MDLVDKEALGRIVRPGLSVQEAIDLLLDDDDELFERDILIAPPDINVLSDEDSGDEDGGELGNLSRRQLLADAEVRTKDGQLYTGDVCNTLSSDNSQSVIFPDLQNPSQLPSTSKTIAASRKLNKPNKKSRKKIKTGRVTKQKKKCAGKRAIEWIKGDLQDTAPNFPNQDTSLYEGFTAVQIFEQFLDEKIIDLIVTESNRYAAQKNCPNPCITGDEIRCFIAILFFSSYHHLPSKRMYWEKSADVHVPLIADAMRRARFEQILRFFHVCDNEDFDPQNSDKLWKLRPLINLMKDAISAHFVPEKRLSYDESMVRYFGKHSLKQFLPTKPIRFGYKVWSLNTTSGYLVDFDVYQGKSTSIPSDIEKKVGKAAAPLIRMIENFPPAIKTLPFHFHIDNLFTSFTLLSLLRQKGYGATGTMRENRIPKSCPLPSNKSLKASQRGQVESIINRTDGVLLCKWRDNSVVAVASNTHGVAPITNVKRYSFAEKKEIQVPRPFVFAVYNKGMGGTDRMDQNLNLYRIRIRNRKWYWPLIAWLLNVLLQNAWVLYRKVGHTISHLEFRRTIVLTYLKQYQTPAKATGPAARRSLDESRFDRVDHLIMKIPDGLRRRCKGDTCKTVSRYYCEKCDVGLCIDCFAPYHTR